MHFVIKLLNSADFFKMQELIKETSKLFIEYIKPFSAIKVDIKIENRLIISNLASMTKLE